VTIDDPLDRLDTMNGTVEEWAMESLDVARQAYQYAFTARW